MSKIVTDSADRYSTPAWINGAGNSLLGYWYFNANQGTSKSIRSSTSQDREFIGDPAFFLRPSDFNANYIDAWFVLTGVLPTSGSISVDANYLWNGGVRGIELMTGTDQEDKIFTIQHGMGSGDNLYLFGSLVPNSIALASETYQQAYTFKVTDSGNNILNLEVFNYGSGEPVSTVTVTGVTNPIKQLHFYVGNLEGDYENVNNYGMSFNNISVIDNLDSSETFQPNNDPYITIPFNIKNGENNYIDLSIPYEEISNAQMISGSKRIRLNVSFNFL